MTRDVILFLADILECCRLLGEYTHGIKESDFSTSIQLQDSVIRRLEIIGEATRNISLKLKNDYPEVPWRKMAGMRDILIHRYHGIYLEDVWGIVKKDIPALKKQIQKIIAELKRK
ncbi:MAG: DUF86 domain-containing protein [Patescibacteria group bacterium]